MNTPVDDRCCVTLLRGLTLNGLLRPCLTLKGHGTRTDPEGPDDGARTIEPRPILEGRSHELCPSRIGREGHGSSPIAARTVFRGCGPWRAIEAGSLYTAGCVR